MLTVNKSKKNNKKIYNQRDHHKGQIIGEKYLNN
jgi:hypothetical protein